MVRLAPQTHRGDMPQQIKLEDAAPASSSPTAEVDTGLVLTSLTP